jgi:hypothetical protein
MVGRAAEAALRKEDLILNFNPLIDLPKAA